jgi:AcrR family transcriptional regulator
VLVVTTSGREARCRRSDARDNRDRILAAAAQAFATEGLGVSLVEIARRAGVGNATLHRNFTKEQLIEELFQDWYARRRAIAERALADPDPWHALAGFLEDLLAEGTSNRAIGALFAVSPGWRERFRAVMAGLLARAQEAGVARADLTAEDVRLAVLGVASTMTITGHASPGECSPGESSPEERSPGQSSPGQWRRHLAIVLDGMRAQHTQPLPGHPPAADQLDSDLREWSYGVLRNGNALPQQTNNPGLSDLNGIPIRPCAEVGRLQTISSAF